MGMFTGAMVLAVCAAGACKDAAIKEYADGIMCAHPRDVAQASWCADAKARREEEKTALEIRAVWDKFKAERAQREREDAAFDKREADRTARINRDIAKSDAEWSAFEAANARRKAAVAAMGAAASAFQATPVAKPAALGCLSDFDCGGGNRCVKANYSGSGTCMRAVNEFGNATYGLPALNSVLPKTPSASDCSAVGNACPGGFRCDYASGACVR